MSDKKPAASEKGIKKSTTRPKKNPVLYTKKKRERGFGGGNAGKDLENE